jgi:hypothetical protein
MVDLRGAIGGRTSGRHGVAVGAVGAASGAGVIAAWPCLITACVPSVKLLLGAATLFPQNTRHFAWAPAERAQAIQRGNLQEMG